VTLVRCDALPVAQVTGPAIGPAVTRLGERPVLLRLHLDDGRQVELAAQNGDIVPASGPFRASTRT